MATTTKDLKVAGMTCSHCVSSVSAELRRIAGVIAVDVDLATGNVRVTSEAPIDDSAVRAAIDEAGDAVVS